MSALGGTQSKVLIKPEESVSLWLQKDSEKSFLFIFVQANSLTQLFFNSTVIQITS